MSPPTHVREVLTDRSRYADAVRAGEQEATRLGITGVPFYVIDGKYAVSGAQPTEVFTEALRRAWDDRPTLEPVGTGAEARGPDRCALPGAPSTD
ncbi:DsbA family oxidoreductase [Nocardia flavorosea]|uniref:DSBA-like thioredoxin domain-containing protein n=1 Tax=Nocardia flavorosea TaxID=53429 RepID=A0A846YIM8_9NOCA|nr:DsbA family protein [Nocardia flavorosea]NKY57432.1 hypothetical protein [Nocardia flavorosea]